MSRACLGKWLVVYLKLAPKRKFPHRADLEQAAEVQQNLDGVFTPERMVQLFEEMDTEKRGYIEVEQAVRWIEEHPDAMKDKHKTALLQQSAPALVEQRAAAAEARRAAE